MSYTRINLAAKVVSLSLVFFFLLASFRASAYTYTGTDAIPQGKFFDANGKPITVSKVSNNSITFSNSQVVSIGSYAFHNCTGLKKFELPKTVTEVGYFAFSNCHSLTDAIANTTIFARLPISKTEYSVSEGTKIIASAAFRQCDKLTNVTLPNSITTIEESAFADCTALTTITIPANTTSIGNYAFKNCTSLSSIYVESTNITDLGENAFYNVDKSKCVLFIPYGKTSAFSSWNFTNVVELPSANAETATVIKVKGSFSGSAFTALNNYISTTTALVVDLTEATINGELTPSSTNRNMLFKTKKSLKNTKNVILNGVCSNLVIDDKSPFGSDAQFTATQASYERSMNATSNWGTICLPFEVKTSGTIQFYTSGSVKNHVLTLTPVSSVPAGNPAIFKRTDGATFNPKSSNVSVVANVQDNASAAADGSIHLYGTFENLQLEEENLYYIASNQFWLKTAGSPLFIDAYRAWFTIKGNQAPSRSLSIEEGEEEVASLKAIEAISDGSAMYFDENGRRLDDLQKGMNIVRMPDGTTKKVLIK